MADIKFEIKEELGVQSESSKGLKKVFNVTGACNPDKNYMVDISQRLSDIKSMVDNGEYFAVNRARQYGKTTTLRALCKILQPSYITIYLDFQFMGQASFESEYVFAQTFSKMMLRELRNKPVSNNFVKELEKIAESNSCNLATLFFTISDGCADTDKSIVLVIDEVDSASNNQIFLDFLAQLRGYYLDRDYKPTFKSVILAGVYNVKNLKLKLRPDDEKKYNSPWNVAVDFNIDMSFSTDDICTMLGAYEKDHGTKMDMIAVADEIYKYTTGYPYLVSLVCKYLDEQILDWTPYGVNMAVKEILKTTNTLFDDMIKNIENNLEFKRLVKDILLSGRQISYVISNQSISLGSMFGIIASRDGLCCISNTIFETYIYNHLIIEQEFGKKVFTESRNQFISENGELDMNLVISKFQQLMLTEYRKNDESFIEKQGRLLFLCFLKPIINGTGHYVVEPQTRDDKRMDIVVFYGKREYIIELKIWHGEKKLNDGIEQLANYLDIMHQNEGWLVVFSFNKEKLVEDLEVEYDGKVIHCVVA